MHKLFQAINKSEEESEVVLIVFERLAIIWKDRILEIFSVETLSLVNLINFFRTKKRVQRLNYNEVKYQSKFRFYKASPTKVKTPSIK